MARAFTGRGVVLRTDAKVPLGRSGLIGYVLTDRHNGTEADGHRISPLIFGAALGV